MLTEFNWRQAKIIVPEKNLGNALYFLGHAGKQCLDTKTQEVTTFLSAQATRVEFISIMEALAVQREAQEEELTGQFLRCEAVLQEKSARLQSPFHKSNVVQTEPVVAPYVVLYFALRGAREPLLGVPVNLFSGLPAPRLLRMLQEFPVATTGISTIISPNFTLQEAFLAAASWLQDKLSSAETGSCSLVWCDSIEALVEHRSLPHLGHKCDWELRQLERRQHAALGVLPVEYLCAALILVPQLLMQWKEAIQGAKLGMLDPVELQMHLLGALSSH